MINQKFFYKKMFRKEILFPEIFLNLKKKLTK